MGPKGARFTWKRSAYLALADSNIKLIQSLTSYSQVKEPFFDFLAVQKLISTPSHARQALNH